MSTQESEEQVAEEQVETPTEPEPLLTPAAELEDLSSFEEPELTFEDDDAEELENLDEDELRQRLVRAEKKAQFEREQRLTNAKKLWTDEAKKHFPYSDPASIKADSRREFMAQAKSQDAAFRERAQPIIEKVDKTREELKAELRAELEEEAKGAWGKPTNTGGGATGFTPEEKTDEAVEKARKSRSLVGVTKALMDGGRI